MSRTVRRVLLATLASLVVYLLSYAPVHRFVVGSDADFFHYDSPGNTVFRVPDTPMLEFVYHPVTLLIARTPTRGPLLWWSKVWRVEGQHAVRAYQLKRATPSW